MAALLPAELVWYATGRFYRASDGAQADYGYFLHLPFPGAPIFDGGPSERTAHFTFAARPFMAQQVVNGALSLGLDPVGEFSLYLQRQPAGTFDDPTSFARGECIATFRRTSLANDGRRFHRRQPAAGYRRQRVLRAPGRQQSVRVWRRAT